MNRSTVRVPLIGAAALLPLAALTACGSGDPAGGAIAVKASDSSCEVAKSDAKAGKVTFEVTNSGTKVTEFYLYGEGDRIMGEVENITPGLTRRLIVEVPDAGKYQTACKPGMVGSGIRNVFTVTGSATKQTDDDQKLADAAASYQRYVSSQADALGTKTNEFVDAVLAGNVAKAKQLYPVSRTYWERIEPVAESFGNLDPKIDGRVDALDPGMKVTGYHRLERDLWKNGLQPDSKQIAEQLRADVQDIVNKAQTVRLNPLQLANGAKSLLDEVATGKITGEEDRYSHTDLYDFQGNVDGSQAAVATLRPVIDERDKALGATLDKRFAAVDTLLEAQREGDGF
ncbi:MAG: iron uptake system protein EfeO, partial [Sciscionella sp.]